MNYGGYHTNGIAFQLSREVKSILKFLRDLLLHGGVSLFTGNSPLKFVSLTFTQTLSTSRGETSGTSSCQACPQALQVKCHCP